MCGANNTVMYANIRSSIFIFHLLDKGEAALFRGLSFE